MAQLRNISACLMFKKTFMFKKNLGHKNTKGQSQPQLQVKTLVLALMGGEDPTLNKRTQV